MFTYDPSQLRDISRGPLMQVRFAIGDTDESQQHVQDEEIENLLILNGGRIGSTAIAAAEHIAMRYAHEVTFSQGSYREELGQRAVLFKQMVERLKKEYRTSRPVILHRYTREQDKLDGRL